MMTLLIVEFVSTFFLIVSLLLLSAILVKHFRGMAWPAYWVYFLGAFSLLAISNAMENIAVPSFASLNVWLRFVANLSILLGSYEIFRHYETKIYSKLSARVAKKKKK